MFTDTDFNEIKDYLLSANEQNLADGLELIPPFHQVAISLMIKDMKKENKTYKHIRFQVVYDVSGFLENKQNFTPYCTPFFKQS